MLQLAKQILVPINKSIDNPRELRFEVERAEKFPF
jgi:hypothetical protein